jgi:hypothetical protein
MLQHDPALDVPRYAAVPGAAHRRTPRPPPPGCRSRDGVTARAALLGRPLLHRVRQGAPVRWVVVATPAARPRGFVSTRSRTSVRAPVGGTSPAASVASARGGRRVGRAKSRLAAPRAKARASARTEGCQSARAPAAPRRDPSGGRARPRSIKDCGRYARRTLEPLRWSEERLLACVDACERITPSRRGRGCPYTSPLLAGPYRPASCRNEAHSNSSRSYAILRVSARRSAIRYWRTVWRSMSPSISPVAVRNALRASDSVQVSSSARRRCPRVRPAM